MADNYDDIRGMQFPCVTVDGVEITCFLAAIDDRGMVIKVLDVDEAETMGYEMQRGSHEEGTMVCFPVRDFPECSKWYELSIKLLREIKNGQRVKYDCLELDGMVGDSAPVGNKFGACVF